MNAESMLDINIYFWSSNGLLKIRQEYLFQLGAMNGIEVVKPSLNSGEINMSYLWR